MLFGSLLLKSSGVVTYAFGGSGTSGTDTATYTFTSVALSTAASNRKIVAFFATSAGGAASDGVLSAKLHVPDVATDPTGTSLTLLKAQLTTDHTQVEAWQCARPDGTTGTLVVVWNGTMNRMAYSTHAVYGAAAAVSGTPQGASGASTTTIAVTMSSPANGIILVGAVNNANTTATVANLTERSDNVAEATVNLVTAADAFTAAQSGLVVTVTWSASSALCAMIGIAFAPA